MARAIGKAFYKSPAWIRCRDLYRKKANGLCERCLENGMIVPGEHVHHKIYMNEETIKDPALAFGFDNLILLCHRCHDQEHKRKQKRWKYVNGVLVDNDDGSMEER